MLRVLRRTDWNRYLQVPLPWSSRYPRELDVVLPKSSTIHVRQAPVLVAAEMWNSISCDVRDIKCFPGFKIASKKTCSFYEGLGCWLDGQVPHTLCL